MKIPVLIRDCRDEMQHTINKIMQYNNTNSEHPRMHTHPEGKN